MIWRHLIVLLEALDDKGKPVRVVRKSSYNQALVNAMVKSYRWNRLIEEGKTTITMLAEETKLSRTYISRIVSLMFLAPDIMTAIMTGSQPATLQLHDLLKNLPVELERQREVLLNQTIIPT